MRTAGRIPILVAVIVLAAMAGAGCADVSPGSRRQDLAAGGRVDLAPGGADLAGARDLAPGGDLTATGSPDLAAPRDLVTATPDLVAPRDLTPPPPDVAAPRDLATAPDLSSQGGPITGGPCATGATGATALRVRWTDGGGKAIVSYEVWGLPDRARQKVGAYGYQVGFTPSFVDPFLGDGGLQLDSSDFVDIELSTLGLSSIRRATLAIYGRSYNTTTSGSFNWMTFQGAGATPTNSVSNAAPYRWYGGDATAALVAGNGGVLMRVKAGPNSNALVVNKIELCVDAQ